MFQVNDKVQFGIRYSNGIRKGGIVRFDATIISIDDKMIVVKKLDALGKLYNLRKLKNGWVEETERDDPKGRLYLEKIL